MKRLLISLMSLSLVSTLSTGLVVSCGKDIDPDSTYKTVLTNVEHWVTAKTMSEGDYYTLANTNATPLAGDEYGRVFGDLFLPKKEYSNSDPTIGWHDEAKKEWKYQLRSDAKWYRYNGEVVRNITVNDFVNTARFVLNPMNASPVYNLWADFIKGAKEINTEALAQKDKDDYDFDKIFDNMSKSGGLGIEANSNDNTVKFTLTKNTPYFESLLTYGVFAPLHDEVLVNPNIDKDYKLGYYSGAFLPTNYVQDSTLILDKNNDYYFANKTEVNRIRELKVSNVTPSTARTLFESNQKTLSGFVVSINDAQGWEKYVGDPENPNKSDGMTRYPDRGGGLGSWFLMFNYLNQDYYGADPTKQKEAILKSKLLQMKEVRAYISETLDRSQWAKYYSSIYDGTSDISSQLRNTFVPPTFVSGEDGKDYIDYFVDSLNSQEGFDADKTQEGKQEATRELLLDGSDFTRSMGLGASSLKDASKLSSQLTKKAQELRKLLKESKDEDIKSYFANDNASVQLIDYESPDIKTSVGQNIGLMYQKFNDIENNPLKVNVTYAASDQEYTSKSTSGYSDISLSGWNPDYADPMTYLSTIKMDGDYEGYLRMGKLFNYSTYEEASNGGKLDASAAFQALSNAASLNVNSAIKELYSKVILKDKNDSGSGQAISSLFEDRFNYTKQLVEADNKLTSVNSDRYKEFSKLEAQTFYSDYYAIPLLKTKPKYQFQVTYTLPYQLSSYAYGVSSNKYFNMKMTSVLLPYDELAKKQEVFFKELDEVKSDKLSHIDSYVWDKKADF
ncbi:oligopeptide ABC transporter substrate-binding protein [Spiroplasma corruscae]|uniref:Oligopeptide ABC transporter substrate-binding protein n=1 Tax=Spiroplasma corruscae TaxID=216934 RepID=A0A222EPJ4_9MOLU|nr:ABC transporter substrate-binding protein [Spiroplasma corruscae]ASP28194.1 oligopeptide ABC transporter substrate-binding protein [Spiroplasma corruscae]